MKIVAMGRRWGKSYMAGVYALTSADHGGAVAWVAPTYKNSRPLWRFVERYTSGTDVDVSRSERVATFPSGGWLGVYSADNADGILGEAFDIVIVDEAARVKEPVWTDVIQPTLADRAGHAVLISTPRGRNWFWREWMRGKTGAPGYASFSAPTSDNPSPNIRKAAELARERVSDRTYRQEWLAEFIEDGGGVFRGVRAAATMQPQTDPAPGHTYVAGLDWAFSNDFTVLAIMDATDRALVRVERWNGVDYTLQRARIKGIAERWGLAAIVAEDNGMGRPNNEQLRRNNVRIRHFTTTNATKADIVEALSVAFEQGAIRIVPDEVMIGELEAFESERLPSGMIRYAAPEGMHDDTVMALALAWSGCTSRSAFGA